MAPGGAGREAAFLLLFVAIALAVWYSRGINDICKFCCSIGQICPSSGHLGRRFRLWSALKKEKILRIMEGRSADEAYSAVASGF